MVWDTGTYEDRTTNDGGERIPVSEAIENGHLVVWLHGQKLTGGYAITRTGTDDRWLLVKMDDEAADARRRPTSTEPDSVETDRSLEEIGEHNS